MPDAPRAAAAALVLVPGWVVIAQCPVAAAAREPLTAESGDGDHPAHEWFLARYRDRRQTLVQRLTEEQREGRVDAGLDPATVAPQILAMFDGLQVQWLLSPDSVDMVAVFEDFLGRLRSH